LAELVGVVPDTPGIIIPTDGFVVVAAVES
jgi:hypothetical protein